MVVAGAGNIERGTMMPFHCPGEAFGRGWFGRLAPQSPRRYIGINDIGIRHVLIGLAVAAVAILASWGLMIGVGWAVVRLVTYG